MTEKDKKKFTDEYKREVNDDSLKLDNSDRVEAYAEKL